MPARVWLLFDWAIATGRCRCWRPSNFELRIFPAPIADELLCALFLRCFVIRGREVPCARHCWPRCIEILGEMQTRADAVQHMKIGKHRGAVMNHDWLS